MVERCFFSSREDWSCNGRIFFFSRLLFWLYIWPLPSISLDIAANTFSALIWSRVSGVVSDGSFEVGLWNFEYLSRLQFVALLKKLSYKETCPFRAWMTDVFFPSSDRFAHSHEQELHFLFHGIDKTVMPRKKRVEANTV